MILRWHGKFSSEMKLPASAPQGSTIGILEYLSATNNNTDNVPVEDRFKYVDDASILEVVDLQNVGLASHNIKVQVSSEIPEHNQFIPNEHLANFCTICPCKLFFGFLIYQKPLNVHLLAPISMRPSYHACFSLADLFCF